jgi:hypothetical protein
LPLRRPLQLLSAFATALLALSCGGGTSTPAVSTPVTTPAPVASSSPAPESGSAAASCPLGMGDVTAACSKTSPQLTAAVEAAIDRLVREKPSLFNTNVEQGAGSGQYRVLDSEAYLDGLVANLRAAGLCAERSLDRERVVAKSQNAFSEEWDVLSAQGFIRRTSYAYKQSCQPASFPVAAEDLVSFVWVGVFAFECNPGTTAPTEPRVLPLACDAYMTATPKLLNRQDVPSWIHGSDVKWTVRDGADLISVEDDWRYGNEFNRLVRPKHTGYFSICATVLGKMGCWNANITP